VPAPAAGAAAVVPSYDHIFVVVEENLGFSDVIGNPAAPNLNALANQFGLATDSFGISHPSKPNYVALLAGSAFGIADDPYYMNSVKAPSLIQQLDTANIPGRHTSRAFPSRATRGSATRSNATAPPTATRSTFPSTTASRTSPSPATRRTGAGRCRSSSWPVTCKAGRSLPSAIVPTECKDQRRFPLRIDAGNPDGDNVSQADPQDQRLVAWGDAYLGHLVSAITHSSFRARGSNAIAITYDKGDDNAGRCDAGNGDPNGTGGGQVATVVVTSHGPRHIQDATPSDHYSLLATIQDSFGLGCLQNTCDTAHVKPLTQLFAVTGSDAVATTNISPPNYATPTPTPDEPQSFTTSTATSGGWSAVSSPLLGAGDNNLGAIAGSAPNDIWAVGNFLPDTATSNQDATLSLAAHYDGRTWTAVPTPNSGPNFNTFFGVAAAGGKAWAVGAAL